MKKNNIILFIFLLSLSGTGLANGAVLEATTVEEIQGAMDKAAHNGQDDTIKIAAGHYDITETLTFVLGEEYSTTIEGAGMGQTILDGGGQVRVMAVNANAASYSFDRNKTTVKGLTIQNGYSDIRGGGLDILTSMGEIIVEKVSFLNNSAMPPQPEPRLDDLPDKTRWEEFAGGGGLSMYIDDSGTGIVQGCLFKGNQSTNGGGVFCFGRDEFTPNVKIINNIFHGNRSSNDGGGLWAAVSLLGVINNTLVGNTSAEEGGGIYFYSGTRDDIFNNIIWGNSAAGQGGDLYFRSTGTNTIIFNNTYGDRVFYYSDASYSEDQSSNQDPLLDADYNLDQNSDCINSGDAEAPELAETDYLGNKRISGETVDRGAIEFGSTPANTPDDNAPGPVDDTSPDDDTLGPDDEPSPLQGPGGGGGSSCFLTALMAHF